MEWACCLAESCACARDSYALGSAPYATPRTGCRALRSLRRALRRRDADAGARRADRPTEELSNDPEFQAELDALLHDYVGRETPTYFASRLTEEVGARIWLKREDLCHTGAHKVNNTVGQVLLAQRMGKPRVIAETGAGQHGVATATACALLGLDCEVYMGAEDVRRQAPNVQRMELLGATVRPVEAGSRTLKDAMNEALRDWVTNVETTYYCVGSAAGPHPYPMMVARLPGRDRDGSARADAGAHRRAARTRSSRAWAAAPTRSASSARFVDDEDVRAHRRRGGGGGRRDRPARGARSGAGGEGVLHGARSYVLSDDDGQIQEAHSISAGLDYPGVGPEHAWLKDSGRARYVAVDDDEALGGLPPACPHRGHPPGAREQPRARGARGALRRAGRGRDWSWSASRAAATRT